jgi:DNA repair exonuclease SbcCD nuclease subunit
MSYGIVSDIHAHAWSQFSHTDKDGVNSRLRIILNELERAAQVTKAQGFSDLIIAGDIFHTRGSIDPEVLNPVRAKIEEILGYIDIHAIPGNHDLKTRETRQLSSAIQNLSQANGAHAFTIYNNPSYVRVGDERVAFVPWMEGEGALHKALTDVGSHLSDSERKTCDVIIHAGIDGVLSGVPGSGLTAATLSAHGFRRVFAGDYHNHKDMGSGVYSIGATTHQTWGDVATRAGFLIVTPTSVVFNDTVAPKFVDLTGMDLIDMELEARGNYVRFRGPEMTQLEINELRKQFEDWDACGVSIQVPKSVIGHRATAPAKGLTLEQSIEGFVSAVSTLPASVDRAEVQRRALEVLAQTRLDTTAS